MKHSLQLKLSQHLTLTPQLQQSIRLLQLSTVELNQELERYLLEQLSLTGLTQRDKRIAAMLVAHLDEDGYLKPELEELREATVAAIPDVEIEDLQIALKHVHHLEPTGVGARDLAECLELQLRAMPESTPRRDAAIELVTKHLDVLAARDFNRLKRLLSVDEDELRDI